MVGANQAHMSGLSGDVGVCSEAVLVTGTHQVHMRGLLAQPTGPLEVPRLG